MLAEGVLRRALGYAVLWLGEIGRGVMRILLVLLLRGFELWKVPSAPLTVSVAVEESSIRSLGFGVRVRFSIP